MMKMKHLEKKKKDPLASEAMYSLSRLTVVRIYFSILDQDQ